MSIDTTPYYRGTISTTYVILYKHWRRVINYFVRETYLALTSLLMPDSLIYLEWFLWASWKLSWFNRRQYDLLLNCANPCHMIKVSGVSNSDKCASCGAAYPDSEVMGPSGADRTQVGPMLAHEFCYLGTFVWYVRFTDSSQWHCIT